MPNEQELSIEEASRLIAYLRSELERQRAVNAELRSAVAEMARAFQETLARAYDAGESGDIERVRRITLENRTAWQQYLQQIVRAASTPQPNQASPASQGDTP